MATREEIEAIKKQQAEDAAKKAADEAAAKTGEDAGDGEGEGAGEGNGDDASKEVKIDYEAESKRWQSEAERAAEAQKKAEDELAEKRFKEAEAKRKKNKTGETNDEGDDDDADKPLTRRELDARLTENREQVRREFQAEEATKKIKAITKSDAEMNLVNQVFKATRFPSWMSLDEQIENAYLIANKKHLTQKNAELLRALSGRTSVVTDTSSSQREGGVNGEPKLEPSTAAMLKQTGYIWTAASRAYTKKLAGGRTLFYDPKSKKRWTQ